MNVKLLIPFISLIFPFLLMGNCIDANYDLLDVISESDYFVQGQVTEIAYHWNQERTHIYTLYSIEYTDATSKAATLKLLEKGGKIDDLIEYVIPSLKIPIGTKASFFLDESTEILENDYSEEACFQLSLGLNSLFPFEEFSLKDLNKIQSSNTTSILSKSIDRNSKTVSNNINITEVFPQIIAAGTKDTFNILGTGFLGQGAISKIQFRNPDLFGVTIGYIDVPQDHIIFWSDTLIQVIVPGRDLLTGHPGAGSGNFKIVNDIGQIKTSDQQILVEHNLLVTGLNAVHLIDDNNLGGYTFSFSNNLPLESFPAVYRAMNKWQINANVPFVFSEEISNSVCALNDGINLLTFDENCELPLGTLSQTSHWFSTCDDNQSYFLEIDIVFSQAFEWYFDDEVVPGDKKDFETVLIHELGHAIGLAHCLNDGEVMYPSIDFGVKNTIIDTNSIAGGSYVIQNSLDNICSNTSEINPFYSNDENCEIAILASSTTQCENDNFELHLIISSNDSTGYEIYVNNDFYEVCVYNGLRVNEIVLELDCMYKNLTIDLISESDSDCKFQLEIEGSNEILVYPTLLNAGNKIFIENLSKEEGDDIVDFKLYSLNAQLLENIKFPINEQIIYSLPSDLDSGLYLIELQLNNEVVRKKIVVY